MRVITDVAASAGLGPTAVAIGKFDGVHVGHRAILSRLVALARERSLAAVAVTFDRHPLATIRPDAAPAPLVSAAQKLDLLASTGVDATVVLTFDAARASEPAQDFIDEVLVGALDARVVLVGSDFRFGARGAGDVAMLREVGERAGFTVEVVDDVAGPVADRRASSSWVRELLADGDVRGAAEVLGRPPAVRSVVARGAQRGRELGYPTANLAADGLEGLIPADGVYAAWLTIDGVRYPAAVSVGDNPTFDGVPAKQVEAYAIDASGDFYDRAAEVAFVDRIRPMLKFDGLEPLIARMGEDVAQARSVLAARAD